MEIVDKNEENSKLEQEEIKEESPDRFNENYQINSELL